MMMVSACMVSLGTMLSVTWILVANSWMQTPAGYKVVDGQFQPTNWLQVIFNPSFGIRFIHMLVGALVAAAWFICGISAWYAVKRRHLLIARRGLSVTLGVLSLLVPLQIFVGDNVAGYVATYKLPQLEAMEGNWTSTNTGENMIVIPDQHAARNKLQLTIPWLGSAMGGKDWSGHTAVPGLLQTPESLRPAVLPAFYSFRVMWWPTVPMLAVVLAGIALRLRGRLFSTRWFHKLLVGFVPLGFVAIWAGWVLAETGRQPWLVYGRLRTADAVSPLHPWPVLASLIGFVVLYLALLGAYVWWVARTVRDGPDEGPVAEPAVPSARSRPLSGLAPGS
jgi:cytochrome d ubiquinol oxidase subunit I